MDSRGAWDDYIVGVIDLHERSYNLNWMIDDLVDYARGSDVLAGDGVLNKAVSDNREIREEAFDHASELSGIIDAYMDMIEDPIVGVGSCDELMPPPSEPVERALMEAEATLMRYVAVVGSFQGASTIDDMDYGDIHGMLGDIPEDHPEYQRLTELRPEHSPRDSYSES